MLDPGGAKSSSRTMVVKLSECNKISLYLAASSISLSRKGWTSTSASVIIEVTAWTSPFAMDWNRGRTNSKLGNLFGNVSNQRSSINQNGTLREVFYPSHELRSWFTYS